MTLPTSEKQKAYRKAYYLKNKDKIAAINKERKAEKAVYDKQYKVLNKEKHKEYNRKYKADHKKESAIYKKDWDIAHKKEKAKWAKDYYKANKESIRRYNTEYNKANPEKQRAYTRKYRAKQRELRENFTYEMEKIAYERFNHKCFNCSGTKRLSVDHHRPLSKGHPLTLENAVILCTSCNCSKGYKDPEDFYSNNQIINLLLHE